MSTMIYKGIEGTCEVSVDDGVLFGKLILKGDLITYEAKTPAGLKREFRAAVDDYLEHCKAKGRDPDRPFKGVFNIRVAPEEHEWAVRCAKAQRKTLNAFVRKAIKAHCALHEGRAIISQVASAQEAVRTTAVHQAPRTAAPSSRTIIGIDRSTARVKMELAQ